MHPPQRIRRVVSCYGRRMLLSIWGLSLWPEGARWRFKWANNPHFLVGVNVVVFDAEGRVLLVRHTYRPDRPWGLPGGGLSRDEALEQCAARELREETGYEARIRGVIWATRPRESDGRARPGVIVTYTAALTAGTFCANAEVDQARFFRVTDLPPSLLYYERDAVLAASAARAAH